MLLSYLDSVPPALQYPATDQVWKLLKLVWTRAHGTIRVSSMPAVDTAFDAVMSKIYTLNGNSTGKRHESSEFEESLENDSWKTIISKQPVQRRGPLHWQPVT